MKQYGRTTITIPYDLHRKARVQAAHEQKSLSRFITELLQKETGFPMARDAVLPFGKYQLGGEKKVERKNIYEIHLRRKVSH